MTKEPHKIQNLEEFKVSYFFQNDPIPPALLQLISVIAVLAAERDWQTYLDTGTHPIFGEMGKEGAYV